MLVPAEFQDCRACGVPGNPFHWAASPALNAIALTQIRGCLGRRQRTRMCSVSSAGYYLSPRSPTSPSSGLVATFASTLVPSRTRPFHLPGKHLVQDHTHIFIGYIFLHQEPHASNATSLNCKEGGIFFFSENSTAYRMPLPDITSVLPSVIMYIHEAIKIQQGRKFMVKVSCSGPAHDGYLIDKWEWSRHSVDILGGDSQGKDSLGQRTFKVPPTLTLGL